MIIKSKLRFKVPGKKGSSRLAYEFYGSQIIHSVFEKLKSIITNEPETLYISGCGYGNEKKDIFLVRDKITLVLEAYRDENKYLVIDVDLLAQDEVEIRSLEQRLVSQIEELEKVDLRND